MQQQSNGIPSLPGVTRLAKAQAVAATFRNVEMRQRRLLARGLAAAAAVFLIAGVSVNLVFLTIGCFLVFGAFLATRPPSRKSFSHLDLPLSEPIQSLWTRNENIVGTQEYEMRHRTMKWD